ncbi:hypothetical protein [Ulvibacter litoralis]|uniref:Uncharacterized protein n=1 Tax=Ulvibacter litoralis TaxID=227084 RepID=A0A1G7D4A0_9FLAO|nr:hypothetical protein [Ulvibacter litoralis]GHC45170.1 hypothetical protein GCM10008083_04850 [Ulvibacter litoralis]SDE45555.1 hypothetical protein SAMN05421855_101717 [Ulvibacter litoralis]
MAATLKSSTEGFYNTMCEALHLSNKEFQLIQGVLPVQSDASGLYDFIDGIPPKSVATLYTSNPVNGLNGNMQIVIGDAKPGFLVTLAEKNYSNPKYWVDGNIAVNPIYTPPFAALLKQVAAGSGGKIKFDSATADSNVSDSWANSASEAGVGFWGVKSSSVSESLNSKASTSRITVDAVFDKFAYLPVRAGGWFTQGFFTDQYQNPTKWTSGQAAWDKVFGPKGSCQNLANQVFLVNGYTITVTSHATYSESEYHMISKSRDVNVWPFYTSSKHSLAVQSHHHNEDKSITTTVTCKPGSLQIMGMGVVATKVAMQGGSNSRLI